MKVADKRTRKPKRQPTKHKHECNYSFYDNEQSIPTETLSFYPQDGSPETPTTQEKKSKIGKSSLSVLKETQLKLIHKRLMQNTPVEQIATELNKSRATTYRYVAELKKELRKGAQNIDSDELVGDTMAYYNEIAAMSLRMASDSKCTDAERLSALKTALVSRNSLNRFLQASGVLDVLRYKATVNNNELSDMEQMVALTEVFLNMEADKDGEFKVTKEDEQRLKECGGTTKDIDYISVL